MNDVKEIGFTYKILLYKVNILSLLKLLLVDFISQPIFCILTANGATGKAVIPHTEKTTFSGQEVQDIFLADLIGPDVYLTTCFRSEEIPLLSKRPGEIQYIGHKSSLYTTYSAFRILSIKNRLPIKSSTT